MPNCGKTEPPLLFGFHNFFKPFVMLTKNTVEKPKLGVSNIEFISLRNFGNEKSFQSFLDFFGCLFWRRCLVYDEQSKMGMD